MGQGRAVVVFAVLLAACTSQPPAPLPAVVPAQTVTPEPEPQLPTERRALAKHGLKLLDEKRYDEAIAALTEAVRVYAEVAPFLRLRIVDAELARGNAQNAAAVASEIIAQGQTSAVTVARLQLPAIYAQLGDRAATDAAWQQAMLVPIDELTESDFVTMATALAKAGREDLATTTRMRLLNEYTQGRYTEQTYGFLKAEIEKLPTEEKLALARKLANANRYDQALELMPDAPEARTTRLRALFNSRHYAEILEETKDAKLDDPALILLRSRAAWRDDKPQEFLTGLQRLEKEFPSSKEAIEAKVLRAKYYVTDEIDYARAIDDLSRAIDAGSVGSDGENIWNLGFIYMLAGKDDDALRTFGRYIGTYPDGDWKTNSLFWSAKIFDRQGLTRERNGVATQLIVEYPYSYYAYRVKELWGLEEPKNAQAPSRQVFPDITLPEDPRLTAVNELLEIGLNRAAAREMKVLATQFAGHPGVQFMLADVYVRGGEPLKANGVLQRNFRQFVRHGGAAIPQRFWEILFPLTHWETIKAEAERRSLDPYLVASIIRQESAFEPTTVSNAGAVGLMQIMPEEASRIATAGGLGEVTREQLFDPATNIAVGAAEFEQKLAAMGGNPILAIAAYNAGELPVGTWIEKTPVSDSDLFIESIPFAETRLYVKTVTRNRSEYRRIYERNAASSPRESSQ